MTSRCLVGCIRVAKEYTASILRVFYPEDGESRLVIFQNILLLTMAGN
jgi:hypothetical protein